MASAAPRNPFAPGPGTPPPVLAGREAERRRLRDIVDDLRARRASPVHLLQAPRGMGKTVLLRDLQRAAPDTIHWTTGAELSDLPSLARELADPSDRLTLGVSGATLGVLGVQRRVPDESWWKQKVKTQLPRPSTAAATGHRRGPCPAGGTVEREALSAARPRVDSVRSDFYSHRYDEFEHAARRNGIRRDAMLAAAQALAAQVSQAGASISTAELNRALSGAGLTPDDAGLAKAIITGSGFLTQSGDTWRAGIPSLADYVQRHPR